ncbi:MAG: 2-hydroxyacid dehydrogenase [Rhodospirillaceae bacterium]|jgi:hydroxypyruvate reductase|nr:2-hydroxyacid dehydrogenase [Rhodospirillaceae bacterium]MBT5458926.1 2-hydroxyacid dehydrogenase [Rhodospirillaceae bacterium]
MKPGILIIQKRSPALLEALAQDYTVHDYGRADDKDAFVAEISGDVRAVLTNGRGGISEKLIAALPHLEIIHTFGVGYEMVHLESVRARGILLANAPGTNDVGVAEMALLLMMAVTRKLPAANNFAKADKWPNNSFERTHTIGGKKLGIIGLGRIGTKIAERAQGFDMEIGWHGPNDKSDKPWRYFPDHMALTRWADYVVLSCPGGDATRHLISTKELEALGPGGILVSVARGSVVDPDAIIAALQSKTIFGAGLDVFEGEPHLPEALRTLDNVILTPHLGAITHEAFENGRDLLLDNLRAHFAGKPVLTPVKL